MQTTSRYRIVHYRAARYRDLAGRLWVRAARYDGLDPASLFVGFSDKNPLVGAYARAIGGLSRTLRRGGLPRPLPR